MEKRKKLIFTSLGIAFLMIFTQSQIRAESKDGKIPGKFLKIGDQVPVFKMEDIDGKERSNKDFADRIIVYGFADRSSNKGLQAVMGPAAKKVVKAFPTTKIAYINFADVVIVPNLMKHIVNPILRYINDSNTKEMKKQYSDEGIPWNPTMTTFILVPEWEGDLMEIFGLENAKLWYTFIVYNDKVEAVLDVNTKDYPGEFHKAFTKIISEMNKDKKAEDKPSEKKKSGKK